MRSRRLRMKGTSLAILVVVALTLMAVVNAGFGSSP
jgi:hypothetical protein